MSGNNNQDYVDYTLWEKGDAIPYGARLEFLANRRPRTFMLNFQELRTGHTIRTGCAFEHIQLNGRQLSAGKDAVDRVVEKIRDDDILSFNCTPDFSDTVITGLRVYGHTTPEDRHMLAEILNKSVGNAGGLARSGDNAILETDLAKMFVYFYRGQWISETVDQLCIPDVNLGYFQYMGQVHISRDFFNCVSPESRETITRYGKQYHSYIIRHSDMIVRLLLDGEPISDDEYFIIHLYDRYTEGKTVRYGNDILITHG